MSKNKTVNLMTAEGGTAQAHSEVIYKGATPFGPYEPWSGNPILTQRDLDNNRPDPVTCAGHADLVKTPEGDWWAVFLACRPIDNDFENLGRETFLLPVKWTEDGWPRITEQGEHIAMIGSRPGVERADTVTFGNFEWSDDFSAEARDKEWYTMRGDAADYCSYTTVPGHLTLKCADVATTEKNGKWTSFAMSVGFNPCLNQCYVDNVKLWFQKSKAVGDDPTGIEDIIATPAEAEGYTVYNLQGICVMKTTEKSDINSLPAGLYIINGKKYIVK